MHEWLIAIIALVFLGIVLDGVRRMRNAGRDSLKLTLSMREGIDTEKLDEFEPELSSGGAKVIREKKEAKVKKKEKSIVKIQQKENEKKIKQKDVIKKQPSLSMDKMVPMLMDAEDEDERQEPFFTDEGVDKVEDQAFETNKLNLGQSTGVSRDSLTGSGGAQGIEEAGSRANTNKEVIVVNVMCRDVEGFQGVSLLESVLGNGMRFGEMNIFHYCDGEKGDGDIIYSMANSVKPGTFDLNNMDSFKSPGVSFFLELPLLPSVKISALEAFDNMLAAANHIVHNLNGELKDENRSVMTGQTVEHCYQRISDFSRRYHLTLSASAE